ncbi:acyltransferase family protein [Butyrivibrio sp. XBB1001]|uniref:acyltransferase family protein n=1 Tax=Butyrivibrio sp. XBB1001 TaxID=1280682 RepID=UPI00041A086B|nr:acyltransferase [Butyrivibrio sp. XBB1001]
MSDTNKIRNSQIDTLRGIAIGLVILDHSIIYFPINLHQNNVCEYLFVLISSVHMPLFFCIAGFCYSFKGDYREYIVKKIKRIGIPYVAFNVFDIFPRAIFINLVNRPRGIRTSLMKIVFEGGEYWFLYTLFLIFLIYPVIDKISVHFVITFILLSVFVALHLILPKIDCFTMSRVIYYLFYFELGHFIKKRNRRRTHYIWEKKTVIIVVVSLLFWLFSMQIELCGVEYMRALLGIITIYLISLWDVIKAAFEQYGKYSLQLYLLNGYWLVFSRTIIVIILGIRIPMVVIGFNFFMDLCLSYLVIKHVLIRIKAFNFLAGVNRFEVL